MTRDIVKKHVGVRKDSPMYLTPRTSRTLSGKHIVVRHMKIISTLIFLFILPCAAYSITDMEALELLTRESKEIKSFPFHVYSIYVRPSYVDFEGVPLPISTYSFFASAYPGLNNTEQQREIFATYQFTQGNQWRCFLLRVPGMYDIHAIDLWIFNINDGTWQKPLEIADGWGDDGYSIDIQTWIEDIDMDGYLDIVRRTLETDTDWKDPKFAKTIY